MFGENSTSWSDTFFYIAESLRDMDIHWLELNLGIILGVILTILILWQLDKARFDVEKHHQNHPDGIVI